MFVNPSITNRKAALLTGAFAFWVLAGHADAQQPSTLPPAQVQPAPAPAHPSPGGPPFRFRPAHDIQRINQYYGMIWGVDNLSVKWAESGELVRFSYHVVDAQKAKVVNDKRSEPALIDPEAQVKLVVPSLEKVGQLRQSSTPIAGKSYWMAFSNKGRIVKRGDRVSVQIGLFRAEGLVVE